MTLRWSSSGGASGPARPTRGLRSALLARGWVRWVWSDDCWVASIVAAVTVELRSDNRWLPADWVVDLGDGLRLKELTTAHKTPFWTAVDEDRVDLSTWMDWPRNLTRAASDAEIDRLCRQGSSGRPAVRGRAFATRTVAALVTYAFEEMVMARVHARVAVHNRTSRAVLERCGFTHEGTARSAFVVNGRRQDLALYGVLPGELRTVS